MYIHFEKEHNQSAASKIVPLLVKSISPKSVVDFGCGLGNWLFEFQQHGVDDIKGYEYFINEDKIVINSNLIEKKDLSSIISSDKKFDLVICLEVAEHLPEKSADNIVKSLTNHSDTILFSAALPHQGGQNHINEQYFQYWVAKFNKLGYEFNSDLREEIWDNEGVDWWYRQNIFIVKKKSGGERQINSPIKGLKSILKALNFVLQCCFEPHKSANGFVLNKSIVTNASKHLGKNYVYNIDLKDFLC
jgi:SAM-dependent methyltransferase